MDANKARFKRIGSKTKTRRYLDLQTGQEITERAKEKITKGGTKEQRSLKHKGVPATSAKELKLLYQNQHIADYGFALDKKTLNERMKNVVKRLQSRDTETQLRAFLQLQTKEYRDKYYAERRRENRAVR